MRDEFLKPIIVNGDSGRITVKVGDSTPIHAVFTVGS